ncbi:MAG TPA: GGDEF domain-containing protein [Solirubrobacterales bacterium]|nr:GGDEF domain-containing protein [Solirubrobacterales bacterium]
MTPEQATSADAGSRALRTLLALVLFGATGLIVLHDWLGFLGPGFDKIAGGYLYDAVVVAAGIALLLRAEITHRERAAWALLAAAVFCWAAGELYWTAFILDAAEPPYPSPADGFYLAFYPLAYIGLALLVRARARELDWRRWTDGAIAALGTAALGVAFVFDFVAGGTTESGLELVTSLAYPLADIGLLAAIVGIIALTDWRPGRVWSLLLVGLAFTAIADIAYTLQEAGGAVPPGNWIDPLYLISAAALGALLWQPAAAPIRSHEGDDRWRELVIPALFAVVMVGLFSMQLLSVASGLSVVLWTATMVAVIVRLGLSTRENRRLLEQVRTDPLTGLGNRGGMQVDLTALWQQVSEAEPAALYLFDLNGFKRYNDTFGHPAGDDLLSRLGARLSAAVAADGSVYRVGGDEFCVLLTCPPDRFDAVAKAAAEALTESDRGVEVSSSWGRAVFPAEAADSAAALQLADVRMYAQKESRRTAPAPLPASDGPEQEVEGVPDLDPHRLGIVGPRD